VSTQDKRADIHNVAVELLDFTMPTVLTGALSGILGLVFYLIPGTPRILEALGIDSTGFSSTMGQIGTRVTEWQAIIGGDTFNTILLWFGAGGLIYVLGWAVMVISVDIYNDIVVSSSFIHPRSFHQSNYWFAILTRSLLRVSAFTIFVSLLARTLTDVEPTLSRAVQKVWDSQNASLIIFGGVVIILAVAFIVHVLVVLARMVSLRKRLL
jgi:hypothetical protein